MKKSLLLSSLLSVLLFIQGCSIKSISHGSEITDQQIAQIEDGKTKKSDIFIKFGNPSKVMDGEKAFFYSWTRGNKNSFLGIGSGTAYSYSLVVIFDDVGVVKSHKLTRGATDSAVNVGD
jgi:outer membrane protein assembly factor BamE (lipoprotein component of BamABCDE complex)